MPGLVPCEKRGGVALLTLNRPHQLNALSYAVIGRLLSAGRTHYEIGPLINELNPSAQGNGEHALDCRRAGRRRRRIRVHVSPSISKAFAMLRRILLNDSISDAISSFPFTSNSRMSRFPVLTSVAILEM